MVKVSDAAGVFTGAGIDFDDVAFFDEEWRENFFTRFECDRLLGVGGGIAFEAFGCAGNLEFDTGWEFDGDVFAVAGEDFDDHVFGEPVFLVAEEFVGQVDHFV